MIIDSTLLFDPAATAITATATSTNVIDLSTYRDIGIGYPMKLLIVGDGLFAAAGAATLTIAVQGSVDNSAWTTYMSSPALSIAQMNASGFVMAMDWPRPPSAAISTPRYLRLNYTVATGPFTAGSLLAGLVLDRGDMLYYPSGYTTTYV